MNTHLPRSWRRVPVRQVMAELRRLNCGRVPQTYADCLSVAARLNWRLRQMPREIGMDPCASEQKLFERDARSRRTQPASGN